MFEKVDAVVELVKRELQEVVVAGYDWEAVLGDAGWYLGMGEGKGTRVGIGYREHFESFVDICQQWNWGTVDWLEPRPMKPSAPFVNSGARGATIHQCKNKAPVLGNELEAPSVMFGEIPFA
jgi:hypothetical protein